MELREKQIEILKIARAFDEICARNNIWYSLAFGSVLGAVRHGGFIPWDPDMDVYVRKDDMERLRAALVRELPSDYCLKNWEEDLKFSDGHDLIYKKGVSLFELRFDIFTLVGLCGGSNRCMKKARRNKKIYQIFRCKHKDISFSKPRNVITSKIIKQAMRLVPDRTIQHHYKKLEDKYPLDLAEYVGWHSTPLPVKKEYVTPTTRVNFEDIELPIPIHSHEYLTEMYGDYLVPQKW